MVEAGRQPAQLPVAEADAMWGLKARQGQASLGVATNSFEQGARGSDARCGSGIADYVELANLHRLAGVDLCGSVIEVVGERRDAQRPTDQRAAAPRRAEIFGNSTPIGSLKVRMQIGFDDEAEPVSAQQTGEKRPDETESRQRASRGD